MAKSLGLQSTIILKHKVFKIINNPLYLGTLTKSSLLELLSMTSYIGEKMYL